MSERRAQGRKETSHERIVTSAARAIRQEGYAGAGVADIMKDAGLTHGGFYAHFASRDAMLAAAADRAGAESLGALAQIAAAAPPGKGLDALIKAYLSKAHAEAVASGCPLAASGSEVARQAPEVRHAATRRVKELVDLIAREVPGWGQPGAHEEALVTVATMVGALMLSRAVDDVRLADALREAAIHRLTRESKTP